MIRRPPRSTLFPYDALPISRYGNAQWDGLLEKYAVTIPAPERKQVLRSEEHTSELQSQSNLVCRLLLEKKKQELRSLERSETEAFYAIDLDAGLVQHQMIAL